MRLRRSKPARAFDYSIKGPVPDYHHQLQKLIESVRVRDEQIAKLEDFVTGQVALIESLLNKADNIAIQRAFFAIQADRNPQNHSRALHEQCTEESAGLEASLSSFIQNTGKTWLQLHHATSPPCATCRPADRTPVHPSAPLQGGE